MCLFNFFSQFDMVCIKNRILSLKFKDAMALKHFLVDHFKGKGLDNIRINSLYKTQLNPGHLPGTNSV